MHRTCHPPILHRTGINKPPCITPLHNRHAREAAGNHWQKDRESLSKWETASMGHKARRARKWVRHQEERRRITNMSERRSEGSRRSRRPRCHRTPGYLWAHLVSPVGVRCLAFLLLLPAAPFPAVQRYPAPLAFQWKHLQDTVLLSLHVGAETKDSAGKSRRVSLWGCLQQLVG